MKKHCFILIMLISVITLLAEPIVISGNRGQNLEADLIIPESKTPLPCLIIAPGKGYHKDLPITSILADKSAENGFVSLKFNWDYHTQNKQPEPGFANEIEDLRDVVSYAKTLPEVDTTRIYLVGKSLGTYISYNVFAADSTLAGLILLTPLVPTQEYGRQAYPGLKESNRNIAFVVGNKDYDNCPVKELYQFVSDTEHDFPVIVVGGDHGLNIGSYKDEKYDEINRQNIETAVDAAVNQLLIWDFPNKPINLEKE